MAELSWQKIKGAFQRFFNKSKVHTEKTVQITQLNQRLRVLRNERGEGIKKLGEEVFVKWSEQEFSGSSLDELCEYIKDKEEQIALIEKEKEDIKDKFAQKIEEIDLVKDSEPVIMPNEEIKIQRPRDIEPETIDVSSPLDGKDG